MALTVPAVVKAQAHAVFLGHGTAVAALTINLDGTHTCHFHFDGLWRIGRRLIAARHEQRQHANESK